MMENTLIEQSFAARRERLRKVRHEIPEFKEFDRLWEELLRDQAKYLKAQPQNMAKSESLNG